MPFKIDFELNDLEYEVLTDCLFYWVKELLHRIVQIILSRYSLEDQLKIMEILKRYDGCCNPEDIQKTATTYVEEVERLAECLEHNKKVLQEIAEALGIDINVNADPELCIEEAIEWTRNKHI